MTRPPRLGRTAKSEPVRFDRRLGAPMPGELSGASKPGLLESSPKALIGRSLAQAVCHLIDGGRIDQDRGIASDFGDRGSRTGHNYCTAGEGLDYRQAESFVQGRIGHNMGRAVKGHQQVKIDVPELVDPTSSTDLVDGGVYLLGPPGRLAGKNEMQVAGAKTSSPGDGMNEPGDVLARVEVANGKDKLLRQAHAIQS